MLDFLVDDLPFFVRCSKCISERSCSVSYNFSSLFVSFIWVLGYSLTRRTFTLGIWQAKYVPRYYRQTQSFTSNIKLSLAVILRLSATPYFFICVCPPCNFICYMLCSSNIKARPLSTVELYSRSVHARPITPIREILMYPKLPQIITANSPFYS